MKPTVMIAAAAAAAMLVSGCANGRVAGIPTPSVRLPAKINSPFEFNSSGSYTYGGKRYRRWREDWIAPPGYVERVWQPGETLPPEYLDGRFTIEWNLRKLPGPGEDRLWVRYGKDALLVHRSGRIDLVIRGFYF